MVFCRLQRVILLLPSVLAAPIPGHARGSWRSASELDRSHPELAWGVTLVILLGGVAGAVWAAHRPSWDAFTGFLVGALWGFALSVVGVVVFALSR